MGCDLVDSRRIERLLKKYDSCFLKRILSREELNIYYSLDSAQDYKIRFLSKRFAAKEAVSKALGVGIGRGLSFCDISVQNDVFGAPFVNIYAPGSNVVANYKIQLSISDEWPIALAFVVISS